jgi:LysR family transcriptional regulator, hydrogen peroxide-inducible genes activator
MPSITQLDYALAVEKHRHFGKASLACNVTQPTLSQQLQKLEDEIGIVLFDRTKKPILPTQEGRRFLEQARTVIREHQKLLHVSKQAQDGDVAGDFRLAVIPTVSSHLLPRFLKPFSKAFPRVHLYIEEMKTESILTELQNDRLDGAILATPIEGLDFKIHPLYYEPFFVYLSPAHPLLKKSHLLREDLDASQMWLLQDGHCFKDQVLSFCSFPGDFESTLANIHFQSGSLDTLLRLVRSSRGYTLIPAMMALSLDKREFAAHVRPFKAPIPTREVSFVYRRDHWKLEIIKAIEDAVTSTLPAGIHRRPERNQIVLEIC